MTCIEVTAVGDLPARAAARAQGDALVFAGERATFAELEARTDRLARALVARGVGRGDRVALLLPNRIDYAAAFLAAARLGAVAVLLNGRFKGRELRQVVPHADPAVLLTGEEYAELVAGLAPVADVDDPAFRAGADTVDPAVVPRLRALVRVRDVAMIMYTSGTTDAPKGCMLTHEALVRQAQNYVERYELTAADRFWDPLPLFHIGGIVPLLACLVAGCAYCHAGRFEPGAALEMLERERCTVAMPTFETIWLPVLDHPRFAQADLGALRTALLIGVPEQLRAMQERLPHVAQISGSGATEAGGNLALGRPGDPLDARLGTQGPLMGGMEARIVDPDTGADLPAGETGELLYRGAGMFEGYYRDPQLTAEVTDADGWFHSGDLAVLDAEGRLTYAGRRKDAFKVGGENVSPLEVEDWLCRHPAVSVAAVVGAPDARYVEVPAAFVELRAGASATEAELIAFCVGEIATFKVPRYVRFVSEWPMSGTKIEKRVLRERIAAELRQAGIAEAPPVRARQSAAAAPPAR